MRARGGSCRLASSRARRTESTNGKLTMRRPVCDIRNLRICRDVDMGREGFEQGHAVRTFGPIRRVCARLSAPGRDASGLRLETSDRRHAIDVAVERGDNTDAGDLRARSQVRLGEMDAVLLVDLER